MWLDPGGLMLTLALLAPPELPDKTICVPAADGRGWVCGRGDQAPAATVRPQPAPGARAPAQPPLLLMDPQRMPSAVREPLERGDYATAEAVAAQMPARPASRPTAATAPPAAPEPVQRAPEASPTRSESATATSATTTTTTAAPAASAPTAPPTALAVEPATEPAAVAAPPTPTAPEPVAVTTTQAPTEPIEPPKAPEPAAPSAAVAAPPAADAQSATPTAPRTGAGRSVASSARDGQDLLALPADAYTIQLAATRSAQGYAAFRAQLGLAVEDTFVIRVRRGSEDWWLLLWRDFPSLESASQAAARLPGDARYWPRRLAPLQAEVRHSAAQGVE